MVISRSVESRRSDTIYLTFSATDRFNHVPDVGDTEVRVALLTVLRVHNVEFCHVNTHLEAFTSTVRDQQLKVLLDDINELVRVCFAWLIGVFYLTISLVSSTIGGCCG